MIKRTAGADAAGKSGPQPANSVKDSAQQIWLAGLGAFAKAQEEGGKVYEALVKEGLNLQRKTQAAAEEKISEAASRMTSMASDIQAKAGERWDKLENIFEDRVAKALNRLGVPSARDVEALKARIDELGKSMGKAAAKTKPSAPKKTASATARSAAKKAPETPARRAAPRKTS